MILFHLINLVSVTLTFLIKLRFKRFRKLFTSTNFIGAVNLIFLNTIDMDRDYCIIKTY